MLRRKDWTNDIKNIKSTSVANAKNQDFDELPFGSQVELAKTVVNSPMYAQFGKKEVEIDENKRKKAAADLENYNDMVKILKNAGEL